MKYLVLIPDGSADLPRPDLHGRTPLEAAETPNFDLLASRGKVGRAHTIPEGFPPGSDVANLCVMGYDPHLYYTGRAPLEAASLGIPLGPEDIAFRCNLVYIADDRMADFAAGHITTAEAAQLIAFLQENLGDAKANFHAGLSYRHIMVSHGAGLNSACTPPHDITGQPISAYLPQGEGQEWLRGLMEASAQLLPDHPVNRRRIEAGKAPANMIWLWGQGKAPAMPTFADRFGLRGSVISAVDLVKGLGKYAGLDVVDVPGATGYLDTDFGAKAEYALAELESGHDFVYIHVEAPDEAGHMGDTGAKVTAIEHFDQELLGTLLGGLSNFEPYRMLIMPDHATPLSTRTHSGEPVPFLFYEESEEAGAAIAPQTEDEYQAAPAAASPEAPFTEQSAAASSLAFDRGWEVMPWFLQQDQS